MPVGTNLARWAPYTSVLTALGRPNAPMMLPCTIDCPLCGDLRFTVFHNTVCGGEWYYCQGCLSRGDMIELICEKWDITPRTAIRDLGNRPVFSLLAQASITEEALTAYETTMLRGRKDINDFWTKVCQRDVSGAMFQGLHCKREVAFNIASTEMKASDNSRLIGSATREEADAFACTPGHHSLFHGFGRQVKNWKDVMVIPFWDMPGHISAILFVILDNKGEVAGQKYFSMYSLGEPRVNPGVAMLPLANKCTEELMVFLDPLDAVWMQAYHLKLNLADKLPVVAVWPASDPCHILRQTAPLRRLVMYYKHLTPQLFKHAQAMQAYVAHPGANDHNEVSNRDGPLNWVKHKVRTAVPWATALETHLLTLSSSDAVAFLQAIDMGCGPVGEFIDSGSSQLQAKLKVINTDFNYTTVLGSRHYSQTTDGWRNTKTNEMVCDASFRVERIVHADEHIYYQGMLRRGVLELPFTAAGEKFESKPIGWLNKFLITNGHQPMLATASFKKDAFVLALRSHKPEIVTYTGKYGWDSLQRCFVLPHYLIQQGGKVVEHNLPVFQHKSLPLPSIRPPSTLWPSEEELLERMQPDVILMLQLLILAAHNVMAPAFGYKPVGLTVSQHDVVAIAKLAECMGWPTRRESWAHVQDKQVKLAQLEEKGSMLPVVFEAPLRLTNESYRWLLDGSHNSVLVLNWELTQLAAMSGHWWHIKEGNFRPRPEVIELAPKLLPDFMQFMATDGMAHHGSHTDAVSGIMADLECWVGTSGVNNGVFKRAKKMLHTPKPGSTADAFFELVFYYRATKQLRTLELAKGLWIPRNDFGEMVASAGMSRSVIQSLASDLTVVDEALHETGELISHYVLLNERGWFIKPDAWYQRLQAHADELKRKR